MRKPSVLHVITRMCAGGAQENTWITARHQHERGWNVVLAAGLPGADEEPFPRVTAPVKTVVIRELVREVDPVRDAVAFARLVGLIRRGGFDLVHTHTSKAGVLGRLAARCAGVPAVIHTPHGHVFYGYFPGPVSTLFLWIERLLAPATDRIVMLTDECRREHARRGVGGRGRLATICSGVDETALTPDPAGAAELRRRLGLPDGARLFGCAARLVPVKGIPVLLDAMGRLGGDRFLAVAGDGPERARLEREADRPGLRGRVFFLGMLRDLRAFYTAIDCLVLPSLNEGMGRVIVEAALMGKPCVASRVSGIPDLVVDGVTGLLAAPGDGQDLARKVEYLAARPSEAGTMGARARAHACGRFTARVMCGALDELYETVFAEKGLGPWDTASPASGAGRRC